MCAPAVALCIILWMKISRWKSKAKQKQNLRKFNEWETRRDFKTSSTSRPHCNSRNLIFCVWKSFFRFVFRNLFVETMTKPVFLKTDVDWLSFSFQKQTSYSPLAPPPSLSSHFLRNCRWAWDECGRHYSERQNRLMFEKVKMFEISDFS